MKTALISVILLLFLMSACEKDNHTVNKEPGNLPGCWINPQYYDSIIEFESAGALINGYGLNFQENDSLIERKNVGWCGTPPITYGDFSGVYYVNDSIITASVGYWGGVTNYTWELLTLSPRTLRLKILSVVNIPE